VIHSDKSQAKIARELGVSEYSLILWKRSYLGQLKPGQLDGEQMSPQQMFDKIRQQQKEIDYLKRQRSASIGLMHWASVGCPNGCPNTVHLVNPARG
jgi:transposase